MSVTQIVKFLEAVKQDESDRKAWISLATSLRDADIESARSVFKVILETFPGCSQFVCMYCDVEMRAHNYAVVESVGVPFVCVTLGVARQLGEVFERGHLHVLLPLLRQEVPLREDGSGAVVGARRGGSHLPIGIGHGGLLHRRGRAIPRLQAVSGQTAAHSRRRRLHPAMHRGMAIVLPPRDFPPDPQYISLPSHSSIWTPSGTSSASSRRRRSQPRK